MTSNASLFFPLVHRPPTNSPNARPCRSSHSSACLSLSGAGPYAIVSKISETVVTLPASPFPIPVSYQRMAVCGHIPRCDNVLELSIDCGGQRGSAEPALVVAQPERAELFFHMLYPI